MKKIRLRKFDKYRVLLTEVLPFEVPLIFSNSGLYHYFSSGVVSSSSKIVNEILHEKPGYTIPFNYSIKVNNTKDRDLSVIHPGVQKQFADFYDSYSDLILSLCSRSDVSLRRPCRVASHFFERGFLEDDDSEEGGVELERFSADLEFSSSFYVYKNYSFIYQFYDSFELINLEKKFNKQMWFDISKCFYNLYSHAISWAVKDKAFSKKNIHSHSFDSRFDELMRLANFNETNGIVVGPEVSRLFAEIIFQKIDSEVVSMLSDRKASIKYGRDYSVKRYIDDYFVFANDERVMDEVFRCYSGCLAEYKLFVNESKCLISNAPFITKLSVSKTEIGALLSQLAIDFGIVYSPASSKKIVEIGGCKEDGFNEGRIKKFNSSRLTKKYINGLREIASSSKDGFDGSSKYILGCLNRLCASIQDFGISKDMDEKFYSYIYSILMVVMEIGFYAYRMGPNVSATYKISRLVYFSKQISRNLPGELCEVVEKYAADEVVRAIKAISCDGKGLSVEVLNLMILLKDVGGGYQLTDSDIGEMLLFSNSLESDGSIINLNYFQIITLLFYCADKAEHAPLNARLVEYSIKKILSKDDPFICSESSMLILDLISCPYVAEAKKIELFDGLHRQFFVVKPHGDIVSEIRGLKAIEWFARWDASTYLGVLLQKKELRSPY